MGCLKLVDVGAYQNTKNGLIPYLVYTVLKNKMLKHSSSFLESVTPFQCLRVSL